jgi:hypothetical protein
MNNKHIQIQLSHDEALVLLELLSRYSEDDALNIQHKSEERALWNLTSLLESQLSEHLEEGYAELLQGARERLIDDQ